MESKIFLLCNGLFDPVKSLTLTSRPVPSKRSLNFPRRFAINSLASLGKCIWNDSCGKNCGNQVLSNLVYVSGAVYVVDDLGSSSNCSGKLVSKFVLPDDVLHYFRRSLLKGFSLFSFELDDCFLKIRPEYLSPNLLFLFVDFLVFFFNVLQSICAFPTNLGSI
jgi:hypothetical protein